MLGKCARAMDQQRLHDAVRLQAMNMLETDRKATASGLLAATFMAKIVSVSTVMAHRPALLESSSGSMLLRSANARTGPSGPGMDSPG